MKLTYDPWFPTSFWKDDGEIWAGSTNVEAGGPVEERAQLASHLVHRYNTHPDMLAALEAVQNLFAGPYYIAARDGADPLAIDATMILIEQAVRAAKGEVK